MTVNDLTYEDNTMTLRTSSDIGNTTQMEIDNPSTPVDDTKCIVFESCLYDLLSQCLKCGQPVCDKRFTYQGTNVTVEMTCQDSHETMWKSQPLNNKFHAGNIVLSCAFFVTGKNIFLNNIP